MEKYQGRSMKIRTHLTNFMPRAFYKVPHLCFQLCVPGVHAAKMVARTAVKFKTLLHQGSLSPLFYCDLLSQELTSSRFTTAQLISHTIILSLALISMPIPMLMLMLVWPLCSDSRATMNPSPTRLLTISATLLLLVLSLSPAESWVSLSRHSTQVALHANFDETTGKLMTTGVLFRSAFKDITLQGSSDTDCYIAVGDVRGFDRALFETPQLCTHFGIFPEDSTSIPFPRGISVGVHNDQAMVATVDFSGEYADLTMKNKVNLPFQSFPIAIHSDAQGAVYVGLHKTGGLLPPPAPINEDDELKDIYEYYRLMTHPTKTTHFTSPQVVKINLRTQEIVWQVDFETTEGRSSIGSVLNFPSHDLVVVVGSSNGKGSYVGAGEWSNSWDGFITLINATSGVVDDSAANQTYLAADHSVRIQSQVGQDDYILGMCASDDDLYVIGTTTGKMKPNATEAGGAFLIKYDIDTLNVQWTQQWNGLGTEAIKCAASSTNIYVAGHVPAGVSLKEDTTRTLETSNDQDLFISLINTEDGFIQWTRQFDSRRPDHLAAIIRLGTGDLAIVGNSMDFEKGVCDIYTSTIALADGFYDWQRLPPEADPIRGDAAPNEDATDNVGSELQGDDNRTIIIVVATVVPCVVLLLVILFTVRNNKRTVKTETEEVPSEAKNNDAIEETADSSNVPFTVSSEGGVV